MQIVQYTTNQFFIEVQSTIQSIFDINQYNKILLNPRSSFKPSCLYAYSWINPSRLYKMYITCYGTGTLHHAEVSSSKLRRGHFFSNLANKSIWDPKNEQFSVCTHALPLSRMILESILLSMLSAKTPYYLGTFPKHWTKYLVSNRLIST